MVVRWASAIPEVSLGPDGRLDVHTDVCDAPVAPRFEREMHDGLLTFLDAAVAQPKSVPRVKLQLTGPLTLGVALSRAGMPLGHAFVRAVETARIWARLLEREVATRLPGTELVLFFDEPALVRWRDEEPPIDRETATDLLSAALAAPTCTTGVHVCGPGDVRLALDAGPDIIAVDVTEVCLDDAFAYARFLEGEGSIAWGAVPTDRPVGENAAPLWKTLIDVWCELTKHGCDPIRLRNQALVTPACGLAGHGPSQAERAMRLAREIGNRVMDQSAATRLSVGA
jgi:hypothetical protein